jgi:cyclic pyranopterin phosphate synthase
MERRDLVAPLFASSDVSLVGQSEGPSKAASVSAIGDSYGRRFQYLRLSITEMCNFRCTYCLPDGYKKCANYEEPLTISEIENLVSAFAGLGFWKVRITGGEPSVRRDLVDIVERVASVPGIRFVALSTNGLKLHEQAESLGRAGLQGLNVSLDSLDPAVFLKMTGRSEHRRIMDGIDRALDLGFRSVKVNVVLMKGLNEASVSDFMQWVRTRQVSVRFIELMGTGRNKELFERHYLSGQVVSDFLSQTGWQVRERSQGDGPAVDYRHPDFLGRMGVIAPYSKNFCKTCNRLRVSSTGKLRLCLFGDGDLSLRPLLQGPGDREELMVRVQQLLSGKLPSHSLQEGKYGNTWNLSAIGG